MEETKKGVIAKGKFILEFDSDKRVITITTPGNNQIVIYDDFNSILLQDQSNNKVKLSQDGISLDSPKDISISSRGKVIISAVGGVSIDSKADIEANAVNITHAAKAGFTAKGSASAEISASGQTSIKGSMVMIN